MKISTLKITLLASLSAMAVNSKAQNLILNPGFENHALSAQCYTNQTASFITSSLDNVTAFYGGTMDGIDLGVSSACYAGGANSGTTHIVVAGLSGPNMFESFSFDLSSSIVAGYEYNISFYAANSSVVSPESLLIGVSSTADAFGTQAASVPLGNNTTYTQYSATFVAPASGAYLTISPGALGDFWFGLDDFSLEINCSSTTNSFTTAACDSYTVPSGDSTYTVSGIYNDTIPNIAGCDSILTIDVTINSLDLSVNQAAGVLTANEAGAVYQWLDCEDMGAISGETSQSYTASTNGDYAVMITANGCTDTSSCLTIEGLGLEPMNKETKVSFFPNPTDGEITVFLNEASTNNTEFKILDLQGKLILSQNLVGNKMVIDLSAIEAGVYIYVLDDGTSGKIIKK